MAPRFGRTYLMDEERTDGIHVPLVLLVDVSKSMYNLVPEEAGKYKSTGRKKEGVDGHTVEYTDAPISATYVAHLQKAFEELIDILRNNPICSDCEIAMISFYDKASIKLEADFCCADDFKVPDFIKIVQNSPDNKKTNIVEPINLALDMVENRKALLKKNNIKYAQPWIVLFTDDDVVSDEQYEIDAVCKRIKDKELGNEPGNVKHVPSLVFYPVALDEKGLINLKKYTTNEVINGSNMKEFARFMKFLGASMSSLSQGKNVTRYKKSIAK